MIHTLESWDTHWTHTSKAWDTVGYNNYKFWDTLYLQDWCKCSAYLLHRGPVQRRGICVLVSRGPRAMPHADILQKYALTAINRRGADMASPGHGRVNALRTAQNFPSGGFSTHGASGAFGAR